MNSGASADNVVTTTDPFAHIDRNQSIDENTADDTNATDMNATDMNATDMNATADVKTSAEAAEWGYFNSFDEVRSATIYHASIDSENEAYFDFPYQGGSTLTITVRRHPQYGDDVIFRISKGQFVCGADDCSGTINFGSGPEALSLSQPTDNSSETLFATNGDYVIRQLTTAKRVILELPFYQEGNQQFTFRVKRPLAWPPEGSESATTSVNDENTLSED